MRVPLQADVGGAQLEDLVEQLGQKNELDTKPGTNYDSEFGLFFQFCVNIDYNVLF